MDKRNFLRVDLIFIYKQVFSTLAVNYKMADEEFVPVPVSKVMHYAVEAVIRSDVRYTSAFCRERTRSAVIICVGVYYINVILFDELAQLAGNFPYPVCSGVLRVINRENINPFFDALAVYQVVVSA